MDTSFWILAIFIALKYYFDIFESKEERKSACKKCRVKKKPTYHGQPLFKDKATKSGNGSVIVLLASNRGNMEGTLEGTEEALKSKQNIHDDVKVLKKETQHSGAFKDEEEKNSDHSEVVKIKEPLHNQKEPNVFEDTKITDCYVSKPKDLPEGEETEKKTAQAESDPFFHSDQPYILPRRTENLIFIRKLENGRFNNELFRDSQRNKFVVKKYIPSDAIPEEDIALIRFFIRSLSEKDCFLKFRGHYDVGTMGSIFFTEYFDGCQLDTLFKHHLVTPPRLQRVLQQALQGLTYLKESSVLHCNIRGKHILVNEDNKIKIIGFSRFKYSGMPEKYFGAIGYAAPEVVAQWFRKKSKWPDFPSDVYSLGATIFYHLFGHFPGYSSTDVLDKVTDPETYNKFLNSGLPIEENGIYFPPGLDALLDDLLRNLLEPDSEERITSYRALRHSYFSQSPEDMRNDFLQLPALAYEEAEQEQ